MSYLMVLLSKDCGVYKPCKYLVYDTIELHSYTLQFEYEHRTVEQPATFETTFISDSALIQVHGKSIPAANFKKMKRNKRNVQSINLSQ